MARRRHPRLLRLVRLPDLLHLLLVDAKSEVHGSSLRAELDGIRFQRSGALLIGGQKSGKHLHHAEQARRFLTVVRNHVGRHIQAGRVWTNCYHAYPAHAAFGGYKQSGIGRETHKMMLDHYQQTKNMLVSYSPKRLGFF